MKYQLKAETVRSTYLDCDFEVLTYDINDRDGAKKIISHGSLQNIIYNVLPKQNPELKLRVTTLSVYVTETRCAFQCTMTDNNFRSVQELGESSTGTLHTQIARDYPIMMASQRAFDRAAIQYLAFPGKVYSTSEGIQYGTVDDYELNEDSLDECSTPDIQSPHSGPAVSEEGTSIQPLDTPVSKSREPKKSEQNSSPAPTLKPGDVIITVGSYRNRGMSVSQIYEEPQGLDFLQFVYNLKTSQDAVKSQITAVKQFFEEKGIAKR